MKPLHVVCCAALLLTTAFGYGQELGMNSETPELRAVAAAKIHWKTMEANLGEVARNEPQNVSFAFTNTGATPLVLTSVKASCGCTVTDYPKAAIAPGESAEITATFKGAKPGAFSKSIRVASNAEAGVQTLLLKGTVL